ncbi:D-apionate lactonase [Brucella cytisi]|uniref:D-apionate lactonase n=1 Tax=Brucella cytisi TaxID=407152 RepID=UPI0035D6DEC5
MSNVDPFLLYGTREAEAKPTHLKAGLLDLDLSDGNLRTITYDGVEVLRAVSYLVRDRDWGTYHPEIHDLNVEQNDSDFIVTYQARCDGPDATQLTIDVRIQAESGGTLTFDAVANTTTGFETNRCGFCILHPIVGVAGSPVTVEHVDGTLNRTQLPCLIEPWQPFKDMRAITHEAMPGVSAECRMEGDTFEMEDQRNWSDASYKTYVRPLALPWPYQIEAAKPQHQRIVLNIYDSRKAALNATRNAEPVSITLGDASGKMPNIGIIITPEEAKASLAAIELLGEIAPKDLLFHYDPLAGHKGSVFADFAALAAKHSGRVSLEIALPCEKSLIEETKAIASDMKAAGFTPDAIIVSPVMDRQSTPPGSEWPPCPPLEDVYAAARAAFPDVRLGGGMLSYFTELNRKRVPGDLIDFVTHCTNPIVHAADDLSVMQTLEALPFIIRSVRAIYSDKPYRIGPSTIPMRQNPYGSRTMENPNGKRIAMANCDPRHNGKFAESFAMAYVVSVLNAGLDSLTLSALTGPFGLIAGDGEPTLAGGKRPLFTTIKTLSRLAGEKWQQLISSRLDHVLAFATEQEFWLVNITSQPQTVSIAQFARIALEPYAVQNLKRS